MAVSALMMAAALMGGDPDGVMTTAPATNVDLTAVTRPVAPTAEGAAQQAAEPHNVTADQQIDRGIAARDPEARPYANGVAADRDIGGVRDTRVDRKMHSEFTAGIGTGGYRDFGMAVTLPIGENGTLGLSYRQTENSPYGYRYRGYGYARSPYSTDGGSPSPGRYDAEIPLEHERRVARPDGLPLGTAADSNF